MAMHGRPEAKACLLPYEPPEEPNNPVLRGLPLYYGAKLVSASGLVQDYLWYNAGFKKLRNRPELKNVEPRYEPTVTRVELEHVEGDRPLSQAFVKEVGNGRQRRDSPYHSVLDYHEAFKAGELTPSLVVEALLPLIVRDAKTASRHATAFLESRGDNVREAAQQSTRRYAEGKPLGVLDGVPVAIKDEEDVAGYQKCLGSKTDYTNKDDVSSYCVQLWIDAGAIIIGKTNMHELGMDTTNNNPNYGTPLNPHNDRYYCGGSSGGSAYAVSAGLVPLALGNDGGGSVRIPSSYTGVYGLKPSAGRISIRPTANLAKSTSVPGPMACHMTDIQIGWKLMSQPDPINQQPPPPPPRPQTNFQLKRKKFLGIYQPWLDRADSTVRAAYQQALNYLTTKLGYEVVDITIPLIHDGQLAHAMTILCEVASGVSSVQDLTPANQILPSVGGRTPAIDLLQAQKVRNLLMQHLAYLWDEHHGMIILTPTTPNAGWAYHPGDLKYGCSDGDMQMRSMEYVWLANFTGCPALSAPMGYLDPVVGEGKVPIGLMGLGEWCSEDELIAFGYDCETYLHEQHEGGRVGPENFVDVMGLAAEDDGKVSSE